MPKRSWLAKANSVHDLGDHFYVPKSGEEWDDRRDGRAEAKWLERLRKPLPVADADRPYFGSAMHDATVLEIERKGGELRVRLDAIDARDLEREMISAFDLTPVETIWPIDLVMHDVQHVRAVREARGGGLRLAEWEGLGERPGGTPAEFLYDWFHEQDGRLQWIAQFWPHHEHRENCPNDVYLMVDGARATAEDRCPEAFERSYGRVARLLYEDARAGTDEHEIDFNVWDSAETAPYLRRRLAARSLTRADFR